MEISSCGSRYFSFSEALPAAHNQVTCQLDIKHLEPDTTYTFNLIIGSSDGQDFYIPIAPTLASQSTSEQASVNQLASVGIKWYVNPNKLEAHFDPHDFSEIARLPEWLRKNIYQQLIDKEINTLSNWYQPLSASLKNLVTQAYQPEQNPTLNNGWLYIFRNGYCWRECQIVDGLLADVNLQWFAGLDDRKANGTPTSTLILCHRINNDICHNEICFSSVQWSWARLNYYGGMDPQDPRLGHRNVKLSSLSISQTAQHRQARMQSFNLKCLFQASAPIIGDIIKPRGQQPDLLIRDPLGLIEREQHDLAVAWGHLMDTVTKVRNKPYADSALLAYQLFFNDKVKPNQYFESQNKLQLPNAPPTPYRHLIKASPTHHLYEVAEEIDRHAIENTLAINQRKQLRRFIRTLQSNLLHRLINNDFGRHFSDHFAASVRDYAHAFNTMSSYLGLLHSDPASFDGGLDLQRKQSRQNVAGSLLHSILGNDNPLSTMLLPSNDMTDTKHTSVDTAENDGSGDFRHHAFCCIYQANIHNRPIVKVAQTATEPPIEPDHDADEFTAYSAVFVEIPNILEQAVNGLLMALRKVGMRVKDAPESFSQEQRVDPLKTAMKWAKATGEFKHITIKPGIKKPELEQQYSLYTPGLLSASLGTKAKGSLHTIAEDSIPIYTPDSTQAKGFASLNNNQGIRRMDNTAHIADYLEKSLFQTEFIQDEIPSNAYSAIKTRDSHELNWMAKAEKGLTQSQQAISLVLGIMALLNIEQAVQELLKPSSKSVTRKSLELAGALTALGITLKDCSEIIFSTESVETFLLKHSKVNFLVTEKVLWANFLASRAEHAILVFSVLGLYFAVLDTAHYFWSNDRGEAEGSAISAIGNFVMVSSFAGQKLRSHIDRKVTTQLAKKVLEQTAKQSAIRSTAIASLSGLEAGLLFLGPYGWVGMVLVVVGAFVSVWLDEDKLTKWAKHGPFAKNLRGRFKDDYADWAIPGHEHYACQALMNMIMAPQISQVVTSPESQTTKAILVEVILPRFFPNEDSLDLRAVWQCSVVNTYRPNATEQWHNIAAAKPYKIVQINSEELFPKITKMQYYFSDIPSHAASTPFYTKRWRLYAKVRLITHDSQFILPCPDFPTAEDNQAHEANHFNTPKNIETFIL